MDDEDEHNNRALSPEEVNRRLDLWAVQLEKLFAKIKRWANKSDLTVEQGPSVAVENVPLVHPAVKKFNQPSLRLRKGKNEIWIRPKGPWVIGAAGRVDLVSIHGSAMLINTAKEDAEPSWRFYYLSSPPNVELKEPVTLRGRSFSPQMLDWLLGDAAS
jgi:hypothetical protein